MKKFEKVDGVPAPRAPYSTYTQAGNLIFIAGQVAIDPQTQETPKSFAKQLHLIIKNLKTILESAGSSLDNILKTTVFLKDLSKGKKLWLRNNGSARSTVIADLVHEDFLIEIEAIAWTTVIQSS